MDREEKIWNEKLLKEWKFDSYDESFGISRTLFEMDKILINNLEMIRGEIIPNCSHPKKLHDKDSDGNLYCMGCNLDL